MNVPCFSCCRARQAAGFSGALLLESGGVGRHDTPLKGPTSHLERKLQYSSIPTSSEAEKDLPMVVASLETKPPAPLH